MIKRTIAILGRDEGIFVLAYPPIKIRQPKAVKRQQVQERRQAALLGQDTEGEVGPGPFPPAAVGGGQPGNAKKLNTFCTVFGYLFDF